MPICLEPLIKALGDGNEYVRTQAAEILEKMGTLAIEPLIKSLGDSQPDVQAGAAMTLGKIENARAVEPLTRTLEKDTNWFVRGEAAEALSLYEAVNSSS